MRIVEHNGQAHEILVAGEGEIAFCLGCGFESDGEHCSRCCSGSLLGCAEFACLHLLESTVYAADVKAGRRPHWSEVSS